MRAIIEIPDGLIRSAGSAICQKNPKLTDIVITAIERLGNMEELVIGYDSKEDQDMIEANTAMMCVTQVMGDIIREYGQS